MAAISFPPLDPGSLRQSEDAVFLKSFKSCFTTKPFRESSPCLLVGVELSNFAVCKTAVFPLSLRRRKVDTHERGALNM